jgi:serine/threonine-protein kinase HipA
MAPSFRPSISHSPISSSPPGFETLPVVEWLCLELGRSAGFDVPDAALLEMPDGMSPALVVERFDIRRGPADQRRLAMEDFCSILDLLASAQYDGTIERMARGLRPLSTDPASDLDILFRRAVFAWLIADGDMHLKNLAVLKVAEVDAKAFTSVPSRRSTTPSPRASSRVWGAPMALKLNGKDDRLTRQDFLALARTIGNADTAMNELAERLSERVKTMRLPAREGVPLPLMIGQVGGFEPKLG